MTQPLTHNLKPLVSRPGTDSCGSGPPTPASTGEPFSHSLTGKDTLSAPALDPCRLRCPAEAKRRGCQEASQLIQSETLQGSQLRSALWDSVAGKAGAGPECWLVHLPVLVSRRGFSADLTASLLLFDPCSGPAVEPLGRRKKCASPSRFAVLPRSASPEPLYWGSCDSAYKPKPSRAPNSRRLQNTFAALTPKDPTSTRSTSSFFCMVHQFQKARAVQVLSSP